MADIFDRLSKRVKKALEEGLQEVADILEDKITDNASLTDHSLKDLEKLGHPYAKRDPQRIHSPEFQVHIQDGDLAASIGQERVGPGEINVGVDDSKAPHVKHVIQGTNTMISRDFVTGSLNEVEDDMRAAIRKAIKRATSGRG